MNFYWGSTGKYWSGKLRVALLGMCLMLAIAPNVVAQSNDAVFRVNQLEDEVRRLNGQLEELNFQLLQMQEQLRKMQEDNEFRFQELEGKKQGRLDSPNTKTITKLLEKDNSSVGKSLPSEIIVVDRNSDGELNKQRQPRMIDGVELYEGDKSGSEETRKELPLGTITFDSLGKVIDTALGKPLDLTARLPGSDDLERVDTEKEMQTLLKAASSAREVYELGFGYFQNGDYNFSEQVFNEYIERYPNDKKIAKAQFWLGESLFSQAKYKEAAKVFLDAHTNWPDARIAPQILLKLGVSLAAMEQRELACATYVKVYKKYPDINNTLRKRVRDEQGSAHCLNG